MLILINLLTLIKILDGTPDIRRVSGVNNIFLIKSKNINEQ
ncbi:hypothetical protein SAMN05421786_102470 [Chryseobacterium ureilyticum]|uniref:Uncharacterized protein n=1 Tax=Chryseobacterium ureilyticum TaxID=373668 RepID=A0A1N7MCM9_9FLAO|nr:hypothetical protein SAMN05421786_102470 [Chryseobacterium ureilyticum]